LVDESAPGLAPAIAKNNAEAVGNTRDRTPVGIAESVANLIVGDFFRRAMPNVAELVAQTKMIAMPESIEARRGALFFKIEEASRHLGVNPFALKDALVDHQLHYQGFSKIWG